MPCFNQSFEMSAIHVGELRPRIDGAVTTPIFPSSTYGYSGEADYHDVCYIRRPRPGIDAQWHIFHRTRLASGLDRRRAGLWEVRNLRIAANIRTAAAEFNAKRALVISLARRTNRSWTLTSLNRSLADRTAGPCRGTRENSRCRHDGLGTRTTKIVPAVVAARTWDLLQRQSPIAVPNALMAETSPPISRLTGFSELRRTLLHRTLPTRSRRRGRTVPGSSPTRCTRSARRAAAR